MKLHCLQIALPFLCLSAAAQAQTSAPAFELATIRPAAPADPYTGNWSLPGIGRFSATHVSLVVLLKLAYGVNEDEIANAPRWLGSEYFDVNAKPEEGIKLSRAELRPRLQALLQQRFHLAAHRETRTSRGYVLVVAKNGSHLVPANADNTDKVLKDVHPGRIFGRNWSMQDFAHNLSEPAGFPVLDQTGISGRFDFDINYDPNSDPSPESPLPSLEVAVRNTLGLELKSHPVPVEFLFIDSIDRKPTEN